MRRRTLKKVMILLLIIAAALGTDYVVGYKENKILKQKAELKKKLDFLALYALRSDVKDIVYAGDRYKIILRYENPFTEDEIYVMTPTIRALVQVGTSWREVPVHNPGDKPGNTAVVKLNKTMLVEKFIEVPFKNFEQVLPGYMHVRINSISYVSSNSISKEDIAERNEDFYVYLKPYYEKNSDVAKNYAFTSNKAPIWIPMPPH
jgi:hypothetical protein